MLDREMLDRFVTSSCTMADRFLRGSCSTVGPSFLFALIFSMLDTTFMYEGVEDLGYMLKKTGRDKTGCETGFWLYINRGDQTWDIREEISFLTGSYLTGCCWTDGPLAWSQELA